VDNHHILLEAERAFYRAMLAGWAGDMKTETIPDQPGFKRVDQNIGDFRVLDEYGKGRGSNLSAGTTRIWYFDEPVWVMVYGGHYREDEIPFLKSVLADAYRRSEFYGCRGGSCASSDAGLIYSNTYRGDFKNFDGEESIMPRYGRQSLGNHWYRGMSLLPDRR
jgi:hypothetical protein